MSPLSSAAEMKSLGGTMPRRGCCQRTSASTPTMRPVASSTSGWNWRARSPSSIARRNPLWISSRSMSRSRVDGSNSSQWLGPVALARAVAASASRRSATAASAGAVSAYGPPPSGSAARRDRDADAAGEVHLVAADHERAGDDLEQVAGDARRLVLAADVLAHDGELVRCRCARPSRRAAWRGGAARRGRRGDGHRSRDPGCR